MKLPVMKVDLGLGPDLMEFIGEIQASGVYGNFGPQVNLMESEFSEMVGVPSSRLVSVSNATVGLQGAMAITECSEWVIPSWTFSATAHAAVTQKARIHFGDVQESTWVLDPTQVREGEGAVVTAPFGAQISIGAEWNHVSELVVDAAASIGAFPDISPDFHRPWAVVVSLHATKVLGIGEGGFVVFSSEQSAERFRQWTNFGFLGSRNAQFPASNGKLSELAAAVARLRLGRWSFEKESWLA